MSDEFKLNPFWHSKKFDGKHIHLGICGSVACYKAASLLRNLQELGIHVSATLTDGAKKFVSPLLFSSLGAEPVYGNMFDEGQNIFAHLEPGQKECSMLIAPATANIIAKIAHGLADDMLSAQILAFAGPIVAAPAMNPKMWQNTAVNANIKVLQKRGIIIAEPETGRAACGTEGKGRLCALPEILLKVLKTMAPNDMQGLKILVTLGPTREYFDAARFWSNPSSGKMGAALATCAWLRGAEVTAVCGPGINAVLPADILRINVETAKEMYAEVNNFWNKMDIGIFCAAVADFAPVTFDRDKKFKKNNIKELSLNFLANPDILGTLAKKPGQKVLGFAAETAKEMETLLQLAERKLASKNADIIAANIISPDDCAFGKDCSSLAVIDKYNKSEILQNKSKADLAWDLCSWLLTI